jgi:hypothetical protein
MAGFSGRADVDDARRPPLWSAIPVLLLPFIPTVIAIAAYRVGLSRGCAADGTGTCIVGGFDLADLIQLAMAAAWLVVFGVLVPVLVSTWIVHRSMEGFGPRLMAGGVLPASVIVGSVIAPTIACAILKPDACSLQTLGEQCRVFGADMQQAFALAGIEPWPLVFTAIPALIYIFGYAILLSIDLLAQHRRRLLHFRAVEAAARQSGLPPPPPGSLPSREPRPRKPLVYIPPKRRRPDSTDPR